MADSGLHEAHPAIVIVDDDPAVCSSLKFSFELEGFQVRTFGNAAELLRAGDLDRPRCFIIDYKLPKTDGLELLSQLRVRKVTAPAILITTHPSRTLKELAARASVRIVEKPLLTDSLIEEVRRVTRVAPKSSP